MYSNKSYCNVCDNKILKIGSERKISLKDKLDWEFDSTFILSEFKIAKCYLGFCKKCLSISHYPFFNTNKLYNAKGYKVRKKIFEMYEKRKYGNILKKYSIKKEFNFAQNEFQRFKKISNFIKENCDHYVSKNFNILDYGGGDGYISKCFKNLLEANSNIKVYTSNFDPIKWKKNSKIFVKKKFDFIIMSHVIEHLNNPLKIIKNLKKNYLNKNGFIFVEVPDERTRFIKLIAKNKIGLHYHVTHHTRNSLERMFIKCNFDFVKTKYTYLSSYRGENLKTILCLAQNNIKNKNKINFETSVLKYVYEFFSFLVLCIYSTKKILKDKKFSFF